MRWTSAAVLALTGLTLTASPATGAPAGEPPGRDVRFTLRGTYTPLTAGPNCWYYIGAACDVRWTGTGRFSGDLEGRLEYSRRAFMVPPHLNQYVVHDLFRYRIEDRFVGRVAGCGEGTIGLAGFGSWTKTDPARAEFRGNELMGVTGATGGLADAGGIFEGRFAMGFDGTLRADYVGRLVCAPEAVVQSAPRRRGALRVGRRCTPRKQRIYRRQGFTCRKRAGRHRLARARVRA